MKINYLHEKTQKHKNTIKSFLRYLYLFLIICIHFLNNRCGYSDLDPWKPVFLCFFAKYFHNCIEETFSTHALCFFVLTVFFQKRGTDVPA